MAGGTLRLPQASPGLDALDRLPHKAIYGRCLILEKSRPAGAQCLPGGGLRVLREALGKGATILLVFQIYCSYN